MFRIERHTIIYKIPTKNNETINKYINHIGPFWHLFEIGKNMTICKYIIRCNNIFQKSKNIPYIYFFFFLHNLEQTSVWEIRKIYSIFIIV